MSTPGKPRQSGIPTTGKFSGIPTPRSRSTSSAAQNAPPTIDVDYVTRAFADAIKANDPSQHRVVSTGEVSSTDSLSPQSASCVSQSGRFAGRPSSVASTSSVSSHQRPKTPSQRTKPPPGGRASSRNSDIFGRSASRAGMSFDLGDSVRIESLGFEGTLRYLGEIDGKPGIWAGVELGGGFAGKGKNNGTVNGKQYFNCSLNCGVFVANTKLSPPTVGLSSFSRPSSVASSRGGRMTPAFAGRVTPSTSGSFTGVRSTPSASIPNGKLTPSTSGRITPSMSSSRETPGSTPAARARVRALSRSTQNTASTTPNANSAAAIANKITAGSRASKYVGMTAKQLSSREVENVSPARKVAETSRYTYSTPSSSQESPTRAPSSPFITPKPPSSGRFSNIGAGAPSSSPSKGRLSMTTPRPRIPSAIAMPPPASPNISGTSRSHSSVGLKSEEDSHFPDLMANGSMLQDKIANLMAGNIVSSGADSSLSEVVEPLTTPTADGHQALLEKLQSRLDDLELANEQLRSAPPIVSDEMQSLEVERLKAEARIKQLETQVELAERRANDQESKIHSLQVIESQGRVELERCKTENELHLKDLEAKLKDSTGAVQRLEASVEATNGLVREKDDMLATAAAALTASQDQIEVGNKVFEEEKRELGNQIHELRQAGQETIALYEERLNDANSKRYELEDRLALLEAQARRSLPASPAAASRITSSATQIDNETLRDQLHHIQKKVTTLEEALEDVHATAEKEEAAIRDKMRRLREKEEAMKKELNEGRKEVERMIKSEASARLRVEEVEEALRESTLTLENARAEVEGMRAELADLDGLVADGTEGDLYSRIAQVVQRANSDRIRFSEEISNLKNLLGNRQTGEPPALNELDNPRLSGEPCLASEPTVVLELRKALEERASENEALKKRINREISVSHEDTIRPQQSPPSSLSNKSELAASRDEIMGLKHIVQELQTENTTGTQRNKLLESENTLLQAEAEQLRQDIKLLEDNLDQSLLREEQALETEDESNPSDMGSSHQALKEQKLKFEMELEHLRKRLAEAEMKLARATHDFNKEISELEALVESKIYREDELEQEVERLKEQVARGQKKATKGSTDPLERPRISSATTSEGSEDVCEICERPGHDIFNCDLLKEDQRTIRQPRNSGHKPLNFGNGFSDLFCVDCESQGHLAADCPHSLDVF